MLNEFDEQTCERASELKLLLAIVDSAERPCEATFADYQRVAHKYGLPTDGRAALREAIDRIAVRSGAMPSMKGLPSERREAVVRQLIEASSGSPYGAAAESALRKLATSRLVQ